MVRIVGSTTKFTPMNHVLFGTDRSGYTKVGPYEGVATNQYQTLTQLGVVNSNTAGIVDPTNQNVAVCMSKTNQFLTLKFINVTKSGNVYTLNFTCTSILPNYPFILTVADPNTSDTNQTRCYEISKLLFNSGYSPNNLIMGPTSVNGDQLSSTATTDKITYNTSSTYPNLAFSITMTNNSSGGELIGNGLISLTNPNNIAAVLYGLGNSFLEIHSPIYTPGGTELDTKNSTFLVTRLPNEESSLNYLNDTRYAGDTSDGTIVIIMKRIQDNVWEIGNDGIEMYYWYEPDYLIVNDSFLTNQVGGIYVADKSVSPPTYTNKYTGRTSMVISKSGSTWSLKSGSTTYYTVEENEFYPNVPPRAWGSTSTSLVTEIGELPGEMPFNKIDAGRTSAPFSIQIISAVLTSSNLTITIKGFD